MGRDLQSSRGRFSDGQRSSDSYINYYIILDTSESMGVGSTATDMTNLFNRTKAYGNATDGEPGCVLGCHVTTGNNDGSHQTYSNEYLRTT